MKSVLHVLPHPGGGGETYVNSLSTMDGYQHERAFLGHSADRSGAVGQILRNGLAFQRAARNHDVLHVHGEIAAAICLASLAIRPSVVTPHGLNLVRRLDGGRGMAARLNLRLIVRAATRTICVSESERLDLVKVVSHRTALKTVVIRNGVTPRAAVTSDERAAARVELGVHEQAVVGLFIGVLEDVKDPLTAARAAVEAAASAPVILLLVGDGPLRPELERIARSHGETIRLLGYLPNVRPALAAADFLVLPSRREGLAYSVLEAMAVGLPPVVSDAPGNVEAVGDAGLIVGRGDVAAFASAFTTLAADGTKRHALGERARERAESEFCLETMVGRTRAVYGEVLRMHDGV